MPQANPTDITPAAEPPESINVGRTRADTPPNPSRRGLIGSAASALLAGAAITVAAPGAALGAAVTAGDDAALVALADEIMAIDAESAQIDMEMDGQGLSHAEQDRIRHEQISPLVHHLWDLRAELAAMTATTLAGFRAKARVVQAFNNCGPGYADGYEDSAMAWSLANDLLGVPSVWAADDEGEDAV